VAGLVADARVLLMDGSTTNLEVARLLPRARVGTVLTNSPPIAVALAEHPGIEVVVIGGRLDKGAQVTVGASAVDMIRTVRADACVLGVCALHPDVGLTTDDLAEAEVKRAMVASSGEVIAPATSDKLGAASAYLVAPVADVTHVVAEPSAPDEMLGPYRALGLSVTRA
jgi:DeoR/GlpR family transcriptional regulator of sugar metabolism